MAENDEMESGQGNVTGEQGNVPEPRFEGGQGDQRTSTDVDAIATVLQGKLSKWLDETIDRRLQSQKDRRIAKTERRLDEFDTKLDRFAELVQGGMNPAQARQQMEVEAAVEFYKTLNQQAKENLPSADRPAPGSVEHRQAMAETNQLLKEAGLDNDPEWAELLRKTEFKSAADYAKAAANFVLRRQTKKPQANEALGISPSGGVQQRPDLLAQYHKEIAAARGQGKDAGRAIREKYREQGLDI